MYSCDVPGIGPLILALGRQRQADLCEFEATLVYTASARIGSKATWRNPVSKNKGANKKSSTHATKPVTRFTLAACPSTQPGGK